MLSNLVRLIGGASPAAPQPAPEPMPAVDRAAELAAILADRDVAIAALERLSRFTASASSAYFRIEAAREAIRSEEAVFTRALAAWAEEGAESDPPTRDLAKKSELAAAVDQAEAEHAAAQVAAA